MLTWTPSKSATVRIQRQEDGSETYRWIEFTLTTWENLNQFLRWTPPHLQLALAIWSKGFKLNQMFEWRKTTRVKKLHLIPSQTTPVVDDRGQSKLWGLQQFLNTFKKKIQDELSCAAPLDSSSTNWDKNDLAAKLDTSMLVKIESKCLLESPQRVQ